MSVFVEFLITFFLSIGLSVLTYFAVSRILHPKRLDRSSAPPGVSLSPRVADNAFTVFAFTYMLVFIGLSLLKHFSFSTSSTDLAQYDQLIWNSLQGRLLENTLVRDAPLYLGKTFTPLLLAFVPLYAVWSNPVVLLLAQTLALGVSGLPIYWFARERLGSALALVVAAAFYLSPALEYINLDEFHEIALATPLLSFAIYFLLRRRYKGFLVCLTVTFLLKEEIAFIAFAFGIFIFLFHNEKRLGFALALFSALWGWLLLQYVIPFLRGADFGSFYYVQRYGYLGRTLPEIIGTLTTRPDIVVGNLLIPGKLEYVLHLFVPLAFVPLIGAEVVVLTLPTFAYTLLSDVSWQYSIRTLYPAPLLPFLFFAAIIGLQRILRWGERAPFFLLPGERLQIRRARTFAIGVLILASSILSYYLQAPGLLARNFQPENYVLSRQTALEDTWMRSIPSDAIVVAQNEFLAHVSDRKSIYEIPVLSDYRLADYLVADNTKAWYNIHGGYWNGFLTSGYFETVMKQDGFIIAKRRMLDHPLAFQFHDQMLLLGYTIVPTDTLRGGMTLRPILLWQALKPIPEKYQVAVQAVDAAGHVWAAEDREPDDGFSPTNQWQAGKVVGDQYALRLPPTMPAGEYQITVAVHKGADDELQVYDGRGDGLGTEAVIGAVRIEKNKSSFTASQLVLEQPLTARFVDMQELRLLGYVPPRATISPGEMLQVGLYWRARAKPQGNYAVGVQLRDARGRIVFEHAAYPAKDTYPTTLWDAGEVLLDWHDFDLPKDIVAGEYGIFVTLRDEANKRMLGETKISEISIIH